MAFDGVCEIRRVAVRADGRVQFDLHDIGDTFPWRWFLAPPARAKEFLAVGIAAMSTRTNVIAVIEQQDTDWAELNTIGLARRD